MPNCLGIYIENNLIKYAKVSKERDIVKIEAFGIKFYEKIGEALDQIVNETFSFKIPISINLSEEMYNYFEVFSLLNKQDLKKALETEFELFCSDKEFDNNLLDSRYIITKDVQNREKVKAIYISANKVELAKRNQELQDYKLTSITPLPIIITNLVKIDKQENIAVVNIENKTTITKISEGQIYEITTIEPGMADIFNKISLKENSFSKAYEVCKNTTIYTSEGKELQEEENEYLEDIMPTLFEIVSQIKDLLETDIVSITKIYLTGSASVINNIDLYFQEYLPNATCEILKPYNFENLKGKVNIKDYIEVNSAIALAMQGIGEEYKDLNFKKPKLLDTLPDWLKIEVGSNKKKIESKNPNTKKEQNKKGEQLSISSILKKIKIENDFGTKLDNIEKMMIRGITGITAFIITYSIFSYITLAQINNKTNEVQEVINDTNTQINLITSNINQITSRTTYYNDLVKSMETATEKVVEVYETKKIIPNFLNQLMSIIPVNVQVTSIENTTDKHIVISAQANDYEQLGYFKAKLRTAGILTKIKSGSGIKQDSVVKVTIEGDIP